MARANTHGGERDDAGMNEMYRFEGGTPFLIWNDELQEFSDQHGAPWHVDHGSLPQMPQHSSSQVLKHIANPSDTRSPTSATFNSNHAFGCSTDTTPAYPANFDIAQEGLRIDNATMGLGPSVGSYAPVPQIITEPATRANTADEYHRSELTSETFDATYAQIPQYQYDIDPSAAVHPIDQSASNLQAAFISNSPATRRNSVSSSNSGPIFSHYGTPVSSYQHESAVGTPYSFQHHRTPQSSSSSRFPQLSPRSPSCVWKSHSRKHSINSLSRMSQQYIAALQQKRGSLGISQTMPSRRKPRIEHSLSESSLFPDSHAGEGRMPGRPRAASAVGPQSTEDAIRISTAGQLQLPMFQPDNLYTSPSCIQSGFPTPDPNLYSMAPHPNMHNPFVEMSSCPPAEPQQRMRPNTSSAYRGQHVPSVPPVSDFEGRPPAQIPVRQAPQFEGDIYTPQYKRRNAKGEWEGWCGMCQPGQWHNIKNSRYWSDMIRNHGICPGTRRRFEDPQSLRIVNLEGDVIDIKQEIEEAGETRGDEWVVSGLDGSLRKREGLCGYCGKWIPMAGPRNKVKGKNDSWWTHAQNCHTQGRKSMSSNQFDNQAQMPFPYQQPQMYAHNSGTPYLPPW